MYHVFCDGASRGQGSNGAELGRGAAAVVVYSNRKLVGQYARGVGRATNNQAEYEAVLLGLIIAWAADLRDPILYSDSLIVVQQVTGKWRCESDTLRPLLLSIKEIESEFRFRLVHVDRSYVAEADALANAFLDRQEQDESEQSLLQPRRGRRPTRNS